MNTRHFSTLLLILLASALSGAAQGTFVMANSGATAITNASERPVGLAPRASGIKVGMYFTTNLSATNLSDSRFFVLNPGTVTGLFTPGLFSAGVYPVPGVPPGGYVVAQIRAWDINYATYEEAGGSPYCLRSILKGMSQPFLLGPLGGPEAPHASITGSNKLRPFIVRSDLYFDCCPPILEVLPEPPPLRIRLRNHLGSYYDYYLTNPKYIEAKTDLASTNWQQIPGRFYYTNGFIHWTPSNALPAGPLYFRFWGRCY